MVAPSAMRVKGNTNSFMLIFLEGVYIERLKEYTSSDPVVSILDYMTNIC